MRVAIVVGICVEQDAISAAAAGQATALLALPDVEQVDLFTTHLTRQVDVPSHVVADAWQLIRHPAFRRCDAVIFHWGIITPLFDALWLLDHDRCRSAVHFHNVTPLHLASGSARWVIQQSLAQIELLHSVPTEVWTYSEFNRRTLTQLGIAESAIRFVPFAVTAPPNLRREHADGCAQLLCVGRIVPAKGTHVAVEALAAVRDAGVDARLTIAGNASFSTPDYRRRIDDLIVSNDLEEFVRFVEPSDAELWDLFGSSDVVVSPSLHEGFCVPIVEGYLAGCHAVGTTEGNLPFIVQPPDPVVPPEDPGALASAIVDTVHAARRRDAQWQQGVDALIERHSASSERMRLADALSPTPELRWPDAGRDERSTQ